MASGDKDEPKTERFNMFMSPSEMREIDEWAWRNRIRSKSEAVRRLVQIALLVDSSLNAITEPLAGATALCEDLDERWAALLDRHSESDDLKLYSYELNLLFYEYFAAIQKGIYDSHNNLGDMIEQIVPLVSSPSLEEALEAGRFTRERIAKNNSEYDDRVANLEQQLRDAARRLMDRR